jgi:hypothetical protein
MSMPLDWDRVRRKYEEDPALRTRGGRPLRVTRVDEHRLEVRSSMWTKTLERAHLERAVELIERHELTRRAADFVPAYGERVTKERRSLAATVLKDLDHLD